MPQWNDMHNHMTIKSIKNCTKAHEKRKVLHVSVLRSRHRSQPYREIQWIVNTKRVRVVENVN